MEDKNKMMNLYKNNKFFIYKKLKEFIKDHKKVLDEIIRWDMDDLEQSKVPIFTLTKNTIKDKNIVMYDKIDKDTKTKKIFVEFTYAFLHTYDQKLIIKQEYSFKEDKYDMFDGHLLIKVEIIQRFGEKKIKPGVNTDFYISEAEQLYGVINVYGKWKENKEKQKKLLQLKKMMDYRKTQEKPWRKDIYMEIMEFVS